MKLLLLLGALVSVFSTPVLSLETQKVHNNIYALVGETGPRTEKNFGSNNTVGFVVTDKGVVLIGSGAMPAGAKVIHQAIQEITSKPILWVVNIGAQDHHWLGNSYFVKRGAKVLALSKTVKTQEHHTKDHLNRLESTSGESIKTINPMHANQTYNKDNNLFNLGGVDFELIWPGNGHFPGDGVLWLPQQKVLFSGDFVFLDRMLGIHPFSSVKEWQKSVHQLAKLNAKHVIPGHGYAADWKKVKAQTVDYLDYLVKGVTTAQKEWLELDETIDQLSTAPKFESLENFDGWHRRNIHRTFLQFEAE